MEPVEVKVKGRVKILEANDIRQSFCVRVRNPGATLVVEWNDTFYGVPGNDATVQIESVIPWKGEVFASSTDELTVFVHELNSAS